MKRALVGVVLLTALFAVRSLNAQWPPDSIENLQVLPEDMSIRQLVGVMRGFAGGLGVRCIYCHVGDDPSDLSTTDFASDERIQKRKAREMLRMVQTINNELLAAVPERSDPPVEVTCQTCHHGVTKPVDIRDILAETAEMHGADSAITQYESLREEYYGTDSYDFSPFMLANVAEQIARPAMPTALDLLEYNAERYPNEAMNYMTMAQIHMAAADTAATIRALERGLEQDPDNAFFRGSLQRLRGRN